MHLNQIIRTKRLAAGLTQEALAQKVGVTSPAVSKWEKGISYPDITLLPILARNLNTDVNTLLDFSADLDPAALR
ncbi:helix-turn-helix domain-containing protein, partial [Streptococcus sp. Marseille-Q8145]